jgi:hypothetical protein
LICKELNGTFRRYIDEEAERKGHSLHIIHRKEHTTRFAAKKPAFIHKFILSYENPCYVGLSSRKIEVIASAISCLETTTQNLLAGQKERLV